MRSQYIVYLFSFLILGSLEACKKQVTIDPPVTQLVTANVFNDNGTATAAQLSVYAQIYVFPYNLHWTTGLSSDELVTYATDQNSKDIYTNSLIADDAAGGSLQFFWSNSYSYIYQENAILEGLKQATKLSPQVKKQLTGEAEFMRAYFYFNLVNVFGDVPLVVTTDYKVNTSLGRTSKEQVYQQIIQDLIAAQSALNKKFVDATDTTETIERIRPTKWAAEALLARAYLYMGSGHFADAEAYADSVISATGVFNLGTDLNLVFKENSSETIWQLPNYDQGSNTPDFTEDGIAFILTSSPSAGLYNSTTISTQLLNAFEPGDQRKIDWIGTYSDGINIWNYPAKYKDNGTTASATSEYTTIFRLAELYLIRAEARAMQGNTSGALMDLNVIRNRAG